MALSRLAARLGGVDDPNTAPPTSPEAQTSINRGGMIGSATPSTLPPRPPATATQPPPSPDLVSQVRTAAATSAPRSEGQASAILAALNTADTRAASTAGPAPRTTPPPTPLVTTNAGTGLENYFRTHQPAEWKDSPNMMAEFEKLFGPQAAAMLSMYGVWDQAQDPNFRPTAEQNTRFGPAGQFYNTQAEMNNVVDRSGMNLMPTTQPGVGGGGVPPVDSRGTGGPSGPRNDGVPGPGSGGTPAPPGGAGSGTNVDSMLLDLIRQLTSGTGNDALLNLRSGQLNQQIQGSMQTRRQEMADRLATSGVSGGVATNALGRINREGSADLASGLASLQGADLEMDNQNRLAGVSALGTMRNANLTAETERAAIAIQRELGLGQIEASRFASQLSADTQRAIANGQQLTEQQQLEWQKIYQQGQLDLANKQTGNDYDIGLRSLDLNALNTGGQLGLTQRQQDIDLALGLLANMNNFDISQQDRILQWINDSLSVAP